MSTKVRRVFPLVLVLLSAAPLFGGCGYNEVIDRDEDVKASWAEVENQYKRRADLVPNLVKVVKGAANFEQRDPAEGGRGARQRGPDARSTPRPSTIPEKLKQFEAAQGQLSGALSRLLVVAENYPDLKASAAFRDLQAQLEGTENRITVARGRFIEIGRRVQQDRPALPEQHRRFDARQEGAARRSPGDAADEKPPEIKL